MKVYQTEFFLFGEIEKKQKKNEIRIVINR